jgi:anti-sigma B factor antagonist
VPTSPEPSAAPEPGQLLSVSASRGDRPGDVVVQVAGEVDAFTAPLLQLCLDSQTNRRDLRELAVDLEQVSVLGAAGVAALARARRRCGERNVRLVLRRAGRRRVLGLRQLAELAALVSTDPVEASRPRARGRRTASRPRPTPWRPQQEPGR